SSKRSEESEPEKLGPRIKSGVGEVVDVAAERMLATMPRASSNCDLPRPLVGASPTTQTKSGASSPDRAGGTADTFNCEDPLLVDEPPALPVTATLRKISRPGLASRSDRAATSRART